MCHKVHLQWRDFNVAWRYTFPRELRFFSGSAEGPKRISRFPYCQKSNPCYQDFFCSQCQAETPTVRNVSQRSKISLSPLP